MEEFCLHSTSDSLALSVACIRPEGNPKGVLQLAHGMCEHKERYYAFMQWMASRGYACVINDHRGHGKSVRTPQDLGYMYDGGWEAMVDDLKTVNDWIHSRFPGLPVTLFGHSMGSLAVRSFAKRYDDAIDTLIVCGCPSDNPAKGFGKFLCLAFGVLFGWHYRPGLMQRMTINSYDKPFRKEKRPNVWICTDSKVVDTYNADPLCRFAFTSNGFYNLMGLMQDCYSKSGWQLRNADMPVHFLSGGDDPCRISDKALDKAVEAMRKAGYSSVTLSLYPGLRHELVNEKNSESIWNDILCLCS